MQKYLKPNSAEINTNEAKLIFNLRSRMTGVKCNFKNEYENLECRACKMKEETQEHILSCEILNPTSSADSLEKSYKNIKVGSVEEKLKVAKKFKENIEKLNNFK